MKINIEYTIPPHKMAELRAEIAEELLSEGNESIWLEYEPEIRLLSNIAGKNHDAATVINWANQYKELKAKHDNQEISMRALMEDRDYLANELRKREIDFYEPKKIKLETK